MFAENPQFVKLLLQVIKDALEKYHHHNAMFSKFWGNSFISQLENFQNKLIKLTNNELSLAKQFQLQCELYFIISDAIKFATHGSKIQDVINAITPLITQIESTPFDDEVLMQLSTTDERNLNIFISILHKINPLNLKQIAKILNNIKSHNIPINTFIQYFTQALSQTVNYNINDIFSQLETIELHYFSPSPEVMKTLMKILCINPSATKKVVTQIIDLLENKRISLANVNNFIECTRKDIVTNIIADFQLDYQLINALIKQPYLERISEIFAGINKVNMNNTSLAKQVLFLFFPSIIQCNDPVVLAKINQKILFLYNSASYDKKLQKSIAIFSKYNLYSFQNNIALITHKYPLKLASGLKILKMANEQKWESILLNCDNPIQVAKTIVYPNNKQHLNLSQLNAGSLKDKLATLANVYPMNNCLTLLENAGLLDANVPEVKIANLSALLNHPNYISLLDGLLELCGNNFDKDSPLNQENFDIIKTHEECLNMAKLLRRINVLPDNLISQIRPRIALYYNILNQANSYYYFNRLANDNLTLQLFEHIFMLCASPNKTDVEKVYEITKHLTHVEYLQIKKDKDQLKINVTARIKSIIKHGIFHAPLTHSSPESEKFANQENQISA